MNKEIDALARKCHAMIADGYKPYDVVRDALMEARALGLKEAAKVADRMDEAMTTSCAEQIRALKGD